MNFLMDKLSRYYKALKFSDANGFSYSQSGEDLIMYRTIHRLGITNPTYLDVGAADPISINNTYLFYQYGHSGVLAEPNPWFTEKIKKFRPRDKIFGGGVGPVTEDERPYYILSNPFFNTFDKDTIEKIIHNSDITLVRKISVPIIGINEMMSQFFDKIPNVFSLDVEGVDIEILKSLDFNEYMPEIICVESISHPHTQAREEKVHEIFELMKNHGYMMFADTYINTIFVLQEKWEIRNSKKVFE